MKISKHDRINELSELNLGLAQTLMSELQSVAGDKTETPSHFKDSYRRLSPILVRFIKTLKAYEQAIELLKKKDVRVTVPFMITEENRLDVTTVLYNCHVYIDTILSDLDKKLSEIE